MKARGLVIVGVLSALLAGMFLMLMPDEAHGQGTVMTSKLPNGWTKMKDYGEGIVCYESTKGLACARGK